MSSPLSSGRSGPGGRYNRCPSADRARTVKVDEYTSGTEVELAFTALGPTLTRVSVEHRGWEHLTEDQLREDCAAPGGYSSGAYSGGWAAALAASVAAIESTLP
ncbi:hypothetical protein ACWFOS_10710 [Gordonia terrae]